MSTESAIRYAERVLWQYNTYTTLQNDFRVVFRFLTYIYLWAKFLSRLGFPGAVVTSGGEYGDCLSATTATRCCRQACSEQLYVAIAHSLLKPTTRLICSVSFTRKPEGARCGCCYCRRVISGLQLPTLQNNCCVVNLLSMVETHSTELVHSAAMHCVLAWSVLHIF